MSDVLILSGIGVPPYSARGASQTLEPIQASQQLRRTINGELIDISRAEFRKYRSTISCADQLPPAELVDRVLAEQKLLDHISKGQKTALSDKTNPTLPKSPQARM